MNPNQTQENIPGKNVVSGDALMYNMKQLDLFNIVMYLTGGTLAGILGLTSLYGLYLFIAVSVVVHLGLLVRMKFDTKLYTTSSIFGLLSSALSAQALTYILFWTFAFALIHIY